jgi:protocatechuate 3,4-dioxygenase beta subunit
MYTLLVRTADGAVGHAIALLTVEGSRVELDVDVASGSSVLRGRVLHADGAAWRGLVAVRAIHRGDGFQAPLLTPSVDAGGRFVAEGLTSDVVTVAAVRSDPFLLVETLAVVPSQGEWVFVVDRGVRAASLRVVADEDGAPIVGATVRGRSGGAPTISFRVRTDADGRCSVPAQDVAGDGSIFAVGFVERRREAFEAGPEREVRLARAARLEGRVVSALDRRPVPSVPVYLGRPDVETWEGPHAPPTTTDAAGRFAFTGLVAGEAMVVAEGGGWTTQGLSDVRPDGFNPCWVSVAAGKTTTVEVTAVRGSVVEGVVLDPSGTPVPAAVIEWSREDEFSYGTYRAGGLFRGAAAVSSDMKGRFTLDSLPADIPIEVWAEATGHAGVQASVRTGRSGRPVQVTLQFPVGRWVEVTVLEADTGKPVPAARVGSGWRNGLGRTGPDGRVRVGPLAPDELEVRAEGYVPAHARVEGDALTVRLERGATLRGRVRMPDGAPAAGAFVALEAREGFLARGSILFGLLGGKRVGHSEADGSFRFPGLAPTPIDVASALYRDGEEWTAQGRGIPGGDEVVLTLARPEKELPPTVHVLHVSGPDGMPVPIAEGAYVAERGTRTFTVRDGSAELANVDPNGRVEVWGARSAGGEYLPYAPARVEPIGPGARTVDVRMVADRAIDGRVHDESGRGVPGVVISTERQSAKDRPREDRFSPTSWRDRTRPDGTFRIGGLDAGEYELSFAVPVEFAAPEPTRVTGGTTGLDVVLQAAAVVRVTVLDDRGAPVLGAPVEVEGLADTAWSDEAGVARLRGLDPTRSYELTVGLPRDRDDLVSATIEAFVPGDLVVRMDRGFSVTGVVRDGGGSPVPDALVIAQPKPEGRSMVGRVERDGTFRIRELPAGEVELEAHLAGGGSPRAARSHALVHAGARDVVLTLERGATLSILIENWPTGTASGEAGVWPDAAGTIEWDAAATHRIDRRGRVVFRGLRVGGSYTLGVRPVGELSLLTSGLRPGPDEIRVRLVPGKTIRGRLVLPAGAEDVRVWALLGPGGEGSIPGEVHEDGTYVFRGLPDGTWHLRAMATKDGSSWVAEASVAAGGTLDLTLTPAE